MSLIKKTVDLFLDRLRNKTDFSMDFNSMDFIINFIYSLSRAHRFLFQYIFISHYLLEKNKTCQALVHEVGSSKINRARFLLHAIHLGHSVRTLTSRRGNIYFPRFRVFDCNFGSASKKHRKKKKTPE